MGYTLKYNEITECIVLEVHNHYCNYDLQHIKAVHDQCERYYLDKDTGNMYLF